jgi:putative oxidoreductase
MLFLRCLLGVIFFWQGYGKCFDFGVENVYHNFFVSGMGLDQTFLPTWLLKATAYFTSFAELVGGALLILGFMRSYVYAMLGLVLLIVAFGHGVVEPIWDLQHVLFRAMLLLPLFFLPREWDRWNLDSLLFNSKK